VPILEGVLAASARPAKRAAVILQRLEQHRALPAVRELLERAAG
jgi:hypothetical protein